MKGRLLKALLFVALIATCGGGWVYWRATSWLDAPLSKAGGTKRFEVPKGANARSLAPALEAQGLVADAWRWEAYVRVEKAGGCLKAGKFKVVAIDYGIKRNILRLLADAGCEVTVLPATATADDVLAQAPDGVFLSNGPGDPAATGDYAVPMIRKVVDAGVPTFGICLGHQMLALALGGKTLKMHQGHHGANHPVFDHTTGKVEITSMNHGFAVDTDSLPDNVQQTHVSLFDGSNCGLAMKDKPVFSVQYHPEASPGPRDSHYLFKRFTDLMESAKSAA